MNTTHKREKIAIFLLSLLLVAALVLLALDHRLQNTRYTFKTIQVYGEDASLRVVHLSDLHSAVFGSEQKKLIATIEALSPDIIVMTGDMIDRNDTSVDSVQALLAGIAHLAPIFAVSGNHEKDNLPLSVTLAQLYQTYGVTELENEMVEVKSPGGNVYIGGASSGTFGSNTVAKTHLPSPPIGSLSILLYHETNQYQQVVAAATGYQYMFSGHTHGGIIRIPLVGGLIDNENNLFPKYASGVFDQEQPVMISSRGLGDSSGVPFPRINNRPEVVLAVFEAL